MVEIKRTAQAVWAGDLRSGKGRIDSSSGVLKGTAYSFSTRFEDELGTNPEELIAAAHAACYSMAFANLLASKGHKPERIETHATCIMTRQEAGGWKIARMRLEVMGTVPGLDAATFEQLAHEGDKACPVSNLLRSGLQIELHATLL